MVLRIRARVAALTMALAVLLGAAPLHAPVRAAGPTLLPVAALTSVSALGVPSAGLPAYVATPSGLFRSADPTYSRWEQMNQVSGITLISPNPRVPDDLVYATGIPGTVGGAIMSNAGAYGWCMADSLAWVRFLAHDGSIQTLPTEECELRYRHSRFKDTGEVVLAAGFELCQRQETAKAAELNRKRRETQPLTMPNAGSMFKNPPGTAAGYLIEQAGLKSHRIGNAQISEKHANFIVNLGGASATDVRALIELAQSTVKEPLDLEVQLVGDWS
ncbi:MAG: UDP-N-acetylmuramate dehydrogenase [Chloroflexota bacterium]